MVISLSGVQMIPPSTVQGACGPVVLPSSPTVGSGCRHHSQGYEACAFNGSCSGQSLDLRLLTRTIQYVPSVRIT